MQRTRFAATPRVEAFAIRLAPLPAAHGERLLTQAAELLLPGEWATQSLTGRTRSGQTWLIEPLRRKTDSSYELPSPRRGWQRAQRVASLPGVRYAEPLFRGPGLEPDAAYRSRLLAPGEKQGKALGEGRPLPCAAVNTLWSVEDVRAPSAWQRDPPSGGQRFGGAIRIAHPDTGFREHPEIWNPEQEVPRVLVAAGHDFEDDDADARDPPQGSTFGHGTATASVILSSQRETTQPAVAGIAPAALLIPLRVSDHVVHFSFRNVTSAVYHAVDHSKAHVISMSLGGPFHSRALAEAIDHAIAHGVIVVAAAGNVWPFVVYPARLPAVVAVAASNCRRQPWRGSAHGAAVDIAAPGESVWRALAVYRDGRLRHSVAPGSGTSYAAATVAGACALWLAFHGRDRLLARYGARALPEVFRQLLLDRGCRAPAGWKRRQFGAGILDVDRLLAAPLPAAATTAKSHGRAPQTIRLLQHVAGYFPDIPLPVIRRFLHRRGLLDMADLLASELLFLLGSSAALRQRLRTAFRTERVSKGPTVVNPFSVNRQRYTPALRRALDA